MPLSTAGPEHDVNGDGPGGTPATTSLPLAATRPKRPRGQWHGTINGYKYHRCHCDRCRDAMRIYTNTYRYHTKGPPKTPKGRTHGRIGTYNDGCRCADCRAAARDYRWKMRRNAAARVGHEIRQARDWVIDYRIGRIA